jgi:hypothetical protein
MTLEHQDIEAIAINAEKARDVSYEHMAASYLAERVDRHDDALWLPRPSRQEAPA